MGWDPAPRNAVGNASQSGCQMVSATINKRTKDKHGQSITSSPLLSYHLRFSLTSPHLISSHLIDSVMSCHIISHYHHHSNALPTSPVAWCSQRRFHGTTSLIASATILSEISWWLGSPPQHLQKMPQKDAITRPWKCFNCRLPEKSYVGLVFSWKDTESQSGSSLASIISSGTVSCSF